MVGKQCLMSKCPDLELSVFRQVTALQPPLRTRGWLRHSTASRLWNRAEFLLQFRFFGESGRTLNPRHMKLFLLICATLCGPNSDTDLTDNKRATAAATWKLEAATQNRALSCK